MTTPHDDPYAVAVEAAERPPVLWGKVETSAQFVVLVKGSRPVVYDPNIHSQDKRLTQVHILVNPLDQTGQTRINERRMIAEFGEFAKVVWPSLRGLGMKSLRDVHGMWAKIELAKTGRTYTTKSGEENEELTYRFVALYASETECVTAFYADRNQSGADGVQGGPEQAATGAQAHSPQVDERASCAAFLPMLVKQAAGDMGKLAQLLASTPLVQKHYTVDSPEVQALLKVAA